MARFQAEEEDDWSMSDTSIQLGEGASARGRSTPDDASELDCYVPERRPSLDLGEGLRPMDTSHWHVERAHSPVPSYTSMESDGGRQSDDSEEEGETSTRIQLERTGSYSSCYSLDSDDCENKRKKVRNAGSDSASALPLRPELYKNPDEKRHPSLTVEFTFKAISKTLKKLVADQMRQFKFTLWKRYPESFTAPPQTMDLVDLVDKLLECYDLEVAMRLTRTVLQDMGQQKLVEYILKICIRNEVRYDLKLALKKKYESTYDGLAKQGEQKPFDAIYTDQYLTDGGNYGPNTEHEIRTIEKLNTKRKPEKRITTSDILKTQVIEEEHIKSVLTTGVAGSGKSMAVQRFILDWAEGRSHDHVYFLFPLPFREINHMQDTKVSLLELVQALYPNTKKLTDFECDDGRVMFICDGLDEYNRKLDYYRTQTWYDTEGATKINTIVTNLVKGNMVNHSLIWITSRSRPATNLPAESVHQVVDVRGFADEHKEAYFRKRFEEPALADKVIAHLISCKTIHIMCHLPMFCWVVCTEFQRAIREHGPQVELPTGITLMYTKLLLVLMHVRDAKVTMSEIESREPDSKDDPPQEEPYTERDFLMKLGKMAFIMLVNGMTKIHADDWTDFGLTKREAVTSSGLCMEFMIEQFIMYEERVQTFIHPTVQEYLAALYVFLTFRNLGKNVLEQRLKSKFSKFFKGRSLMELNRSAVELTLQSPGGNLDLFLRFLLGMSLPANQELLQRFLTSKHRFSSSADKDTASLLRKKIKEKNHPEKHAILELCLEELGMAGVASRSNSVCESSD